MKTKSIGPNKNSEDFFPPPKRPKNQLPLRTSDNHSMDATTAANSLVNLSPILQYGFAGFSLVLVAVIVWLIRQLLAVLRANNRALSSLTAALVKVTEDTGETRHEVRQLREELLKRSCLLESSQVKALLAGQG